MSIKRAVRAALLFVLLSLLASSSASAAPPGFSVNRFEPSERGSTWFVLESLDLRGTARPAFGAVLDYQYRPLAIYESDGTVRAAVVGHVLTAHVGASVVLWQLARFGASLPVVVYTDGESGTLRGITYAAPAQSQAIGDARLTLDMRMFGTAADPLTMAFGARLWLPTGSTTSYTGDGSTRGGPRLAAAGVVGVFAYGAHLGVTFRNPTTKDFANSAVGNELAYGASAGVRLAHGQLLLGPELYGSTALADAGKTRASPLELLLGGHLATSSGVRVGLGVGTGVVAGYGSPIARAVASLEWSPEIVEDEDGDGIPDNADACKTVRGVRSADPTLNGCPPVAPLDTDGDDIPDSEDACMDVRGERTNDPRTNGCIDRDGDGIMDPLDHCPFEAGPPSKDPMKHGCPERDTDEDGILDDVDACVDTPGVKTSDPKTNGCPPPPDPDRDKDGILNADDACPDEPGTADPDPRKNGCPKAFVRNGQIRIAEQVKFKTNKAEILPGKDSEDILEAVRAILVAHPEITKLRVEGHTDNRGNAKFNKTLSDQRAASVKKWLVAHGIDAARLSSVGHGQERPIESNETEEGRQTNRRVELHIETQSEGAPLAP